MEPTIPGQYSLVWADDWKKNQMSPTPLSKATIDTDNRTLRFALSNAEVDPSRASFCLMIIGPRGKVPVHHAKSGANKYKFRNPLWESELTRIAHIQQLNGEIETNRIKLGSLQERLEDVAGKLKQYDALSLEECQEGPAQEVLNTPDSIIPEANQKEVASRVCAGAWEKVMGTSVEKLFTAIGKSEAWVERGKFVGLLNKLNVKLRMSSEINAFRIAAEQGESFLDYDKALTKFRSLIENCEFKLEERFLQDSRSWDAHLKEIQDAPRQFLEECRVHGETYKEGKEKLIHLKSDTDTKISKMQNLQGNVPKTIESILLNPYSCSSK